MHPCCCIICINRSLFGCWFSRMYLCFDPYAPPCFRLYKKDIRTARRQSCVYRTAVCCEKICPVSLVSVCILVLKVLFLFCFLVRFRRSFYCLAVKHCKLSPMQLFRLFYLMLFCSNCCFFLLLCIVALFP